LANLAAPCGHEGAMAVKQDAKHEPPENRENSQRFMIRVYLKS
jgi:hypothetical protein